MLGEMIKEMKEAREKRNWHRFDVLDCELYDIKEALRKRYMRN